MTIWETEELHGEAVLVTGANGFIGSHRRTVEWYREQRADADPRPQPVLPS
jgi:hypothetical protein